MAEEHARANDLWGRGGVRDVEDAIRPWRDRVSIVVELQLRSDQLYIGGLPPIDITLDGPDGPAPLDVQPSPRYANCGADTKTCLMAGGPVAFVFDAAAIGQMTRIVRVVSDEKELTRTTIDFARLD